MCQIRVFFSRTSQLFNRIADNSLGDKKPRLQFIKKKNREIRTSADTKLWLFMYSL